MTLKNPPAGSGSGSGSDVSEPMMDERKRKRMLSNRESARRSRMKKQKLVEDLLTQASQFQTENHQLKQQINGAIQNFAEIESANNVLRAQLMELTDRLRSLNSVLQVFEEVSGLSVDIPEIPDPMLMHWQMPFPAAEMFHT